MTDSQRVRHEGERESLTWFRTTLCVVVSNAARPTMLPAPRPSRIAMIHSF